MQYLNDAIAIMSPGPWAQLIKVRNCPCIDGIRRTVHNIGTPDTMWSAPGRVYVQGKTVSGFVAFGTSYTPHTNGPFFHASESGLNYHLLKEN